MAGGITKLLVRARPTQASVVYSRTRVHVYILVGRTLTGRVEAGFKCHPVTTIESSPAFNCARAMMGQGRARHHVKQTETSRQQAGIEAREPIQSQTRVLTMPWMAGCP